MKHSGPCDALADTLAEVKAKVKTLAKTLQDLEADPLLDRKAATLLKVVAKIFADTQV